MEHHFVAVKLHFAEKVMPTLHQLLESNDQEGKKGLATTYSADEEEEFMGIVKQIVDKSSANPHEVLVESGIDFIPDHFFNNWLYPVNQSSIVILEQPVLKLHFIFHLCASESNTM